MKKILKIILKAIFHFIIFIVASLLILFIIDKFLDENDDSKWNDYNITVNNMNTEKLYWGSYDDYDFYWIYNDEEIPPKKDKKRILVLGDSFVWGDGYSNANILWWQKLRNKLLENGYNDVEVFAMAKCALNTYEEYQMILKNDIKNTIDPDLIIFGWVQNDLHPIEGGTTFDIYTKDLDVRIDWDPISNYLPEFASNFFRTYYPNIYRNITNKICENSKNPRYNFMIYDENSYTKPYLKLYEKSILSSLKSYIEDELDLPYFFVATSHDYNEPFAKRLDIVKPIFEKLNIKFYDDLEGMGEYDENLSIINPKNGHPGPKSTEYLSKYVFEILEKDYREIIGNKTKVKMDEIIINDPMPRKIQLEKLEDNIFKFKYPSSNEENAFLNMPIGKDYIKLNFMYPIDIETVEITGDDIKNIEIYVNKVNESLGYDDLEFYEVEDKNNNIWNVNEEKVTTINVHADIKDGKSSILNIKINKKTK